MADKYRLEYKCRLCDERFAISFIDYDTADSLLYHTDDIKDATIQGRPHDCSDGSLGIAHLTGARKIN